MENINTNTNTNVSDDSEMKRDKRAEEVGRNETQ
jgi:hypothetical protein